jgi:hypothetical protein
MTEQPTTCPYCGNRTEIILDLIRTNLKAQIQQCLNGNCRKIFVEEEDFEFLKSLG